MKGFLRSKFVLSLVSLILIMAAAIVPLSGAITHSYAQGTVTITEFPTETSDSGLEGITSGPDGNLWFTEGLDVPTSKIGEITPSGTVTAEYSTPTSGSRPWDITSGPDGNLWFTEGSVHQIGKITPSGTVTEYLIPNSLSQPIGITSGPDGNLWFTDFAADKIGKITPSGTVTEYPIPSSNGPWGITSGSNGNLWFTEPNGNKIGEIATSGTIAEFSIPTSNSGPVNIASGPDGNLWFTEPNMNKIGEITPSGTVTAQYLIPTSNSTPYAIASGPDGNLWFTEQQASKIGEITPSGTITEYPTPTSNSVPRRITSGPDGNLWFTESGVNQIGRVNLSSCPTGSVTSNTQSNGNPSAPACKTTLWGVDSIKPITPSFYNSIVATFGKPDFFGRKIGDAKTAFQLHPKNSPCTPSTSSKNPYHTMTANEVITAHTLGLAILPFYFSYPTLSVYDDDKGAEKWHCGEQYAKAAIEFAKSAPGFSTGQGTAIFVDIERTNSSGTPVVTDADFIQGWFDAFNTIWTYTSPYDGSLQTYPAGYYKAGYYANTNSTANFDGPFCTAVSREAAIGKNSFIWTTQPNKAVLSSNKPLPVIAQKANAPGYSPGLVSCPPLAAQIPTPASWQYAINSQSRPYKVNVDIDEALPDLPLWKP